MAKRKKRSRKKQQNSPEPKTNSLFWRQVLVFVLIIIAIFLLVGGFNSGGPLPQKLFEIAGWVLGAVAYLLPFVLIAIAIQKFRHEDHVLPGLKFGGALLLLSSLATLFHIFLNDEKASLAASQGTYGGQLGQLVSRAVLNILNETTAFIVFAVIAWVAFMMLFGIDPKRMILFALGIFRREHEESELMALRKGNERNFQLHEGVPIEHSNVNEERHRPRLSTFKNSVENISPKENHAAFTVENDPNWKFPSIDLLNQKQDKADPGNVEAKADTIKSTLAGFGIDVEMEGANIGPRVTQYTLLPSSGQKLSKIASHEQDISYELAATSIRIEAPIPGKRAVGVEVPNLKAASVRVSSILSSKEWSNTTSNLSFAVGKDISGNPIVASLDKMPHLLIAGQTGSGKSVMINTLLTSLTYRSSPSDLKLILVDPKQVELTPYNGIPHLLTPVITEPEKCISALKWSVAEMERRLRTFSEIGKRNIAEYNEFKKEEGMPYIVIVIDELADLMMMAARDVEALVVRIAQKARAAGIHLVLATQRPSVNVITGLIKANVPSRIAFTVVSQVDSRTIIDQSGAEKLLGTGDMLYVTTDMSKPMRLQGALIEKDEIDKVNDFLRNQREPSYNDEVVSMPVQLNGKGGIVADNVGGESDDAMWKDAVQVVLDSGKASTSLLQRRLRIGYGRASRMIDEMEERGIVGPAEGSRPRDVLVRSMDEVYSSNEPSMDLETDDEYDPSDSEDNY